MKTFNHCPSLGNYITLYFWPHQFPPHVRSMADFIGINYKPQRHD